LVLNNLIRVAAGDAEALAALYEALFPRVVSHLRGRFDNLDEGEIEGAAQQTMLQVWQKAATFRGQTEREAMGWVMRIAERKALDLLRLETRSTELDPERHSAYDRVDETDWPRFFSRLTQREREVVELLYQGYKAVEIAAGLQISEPRVTQLIHAVREKARKWLV